MSIKAAIKIVAIAVLFLSEPASSQIPATCSDSSSWRIQFAVQTQEKESVAGHGLSEPAWIQQ